MEFGEHANSGQKEKLIMKSFLSRSHKKRFSSLKIAALIIQSQAAFERVAIGV